jgi:hypothetical protein
MQLRNAGYEVTSALEFTGALSYCKQLVFDVSVLGHTISQTGQWMRCIHPSSPQADTIERAFLQTGNALLPTSKQ